MNPRQRALLAFLFLIAFAAFLLFLFPFALAFLEKATRSLRYLWWIILLLALGLWLLWSGSRKP